MEYFHNEGMSKTIVNGKEINETDWDANYDGKQAYLKLNVFDHGKKKHINMNLDKKDLAKIMIFQPVIDEEMENNIISNYQSNLNNELIREFSNGKSGKSSKSSKSKKRKGGRGKKRRKSRKRKSKGR